MKKITYCLKAVLITLLVSVATAEAATVEFQRKSPGSFKTIPQLVSKQFPTFSTMLP